MIMDGTTVEVGMLVFHIQFGTGEVTSVHRDGQMTVRYGRGNITTTQAEVEIPLDKGRMIYWRNPVMFAPPANDLAWKALNTFIESSKTAVAAVTGVRV